MSDNRRNTYRCPATNFPDAVILIREGKKTISSDVNIFDESAGGFGAFIPTAPRFEMGDTVALQYSEKELLCKVSYIKEEEQGIHRLGLEVIDEIEDEPEKKNVVAAGRTTYFANSSSIMPVAVALVIFVVSLGGFLYYESTKEYTDEFGRKYKGSPKTAFDNMYRSVFGGKKEKR